MNKSNNKYDNTEKDVKYSNKNNKKGKNKSKHGKKNDVRWYGKNPILMKLAGLVNFLYRLGAKIPIIKNTVFSDKLRGLYLPAPKTLPGVMSLTWIPTPGVCLNPESPFNKMMAKLYMLLRQKNFSLSAYDAPDIGMYFLGADSLLAFYGYLVQIYVHAKSYKFTNSYYPKAILQAMNVDPDDITNKLDDLLFYINVCKHRLNEIIKIPKELDYISRHMHMSAQIYKDADVEKSQLYVFVPGFLWEYDATVPEMKPVNIGFEPLPLKVADLKLKFDAMMDAILPDEDFGIIAADIVKFYGGDTWTVADVDWNSMQEPVYNKEMLWQIHNSNFLPYTSVQYMNIGQVVTANNNTIIKWDPLFTSNEHGVNLQRILTSDVDAPEASEIVESTRLMFTVRDFTRVNKDDCTFRLDACGTEIITNAKIFQFTEDGIVISKPFTSFIRCDISDIGGNPYIVFPLDPANPNIALNTDLYSLIFGHVFDYKPIGYVVCQRGAVGQEEDVFLGFAAPITNYAIVEEQQIDALHEQSLLSQFALQSRA